MSTEPNLFVQFALDAIAVLVFAVFTMSMLTALNQVGGWQAKVFTGVLAGVGMYFLARGLVNLRRTWRRGSVPDLDA